MSAEAPGAEGPVALQLADPGLALPAGSDVAAWCEAALELAGPGAPVQVTVRIVDLEEGRQLNATWRGKPAPTNVLAFPGPVLQPDPGAPRELGDIVICLPVALREAAEQGRNEVDYLAHLVVHGMLHLLGYTHDEDRAARAMEALETRVLAALGLADPYGGDSAADAAS